MYLFYRDRSAIATDEQQYGETPDEKPKRKKRKKPRKVDPENGDEKPHRPKKIVSKKQSGMSDRTVNIIVFILGNYNALVNKARPV